MADTTNVYFQQAGAGVKPEPQRPPIKPPPGPKEPPRKPPDRDKPPPIKAADTR
jgi:hypothetical protein